VRQHDEELELGIVSRAGAGAQVRIGGKREVYLGGNREWYLELRVVS
jgi:hypothetical protein